MSIYYLSGTGIEQTVYSYGTFNTNNPLGCSTNIFYLSI